MKISYDISFTQDEIKRFEEKGITVQQAGKTRLQDKLFEKILYNIKIEETESFDNKITFRSNFFILHNDQVKHIASLLNILEKEDTKRAILREIVDM